MKIFYSVIATMAMVTFSSCAREEATPGPKAAPIPLDINVGVMPVTGEVAGKSSRAGVVLGTAFPNEHKINVILVDEIPLNNTPDYPVEAPYICSVTGVDPDVVTAWSPVDVTKPLMVVINKAKVLAHSPAVLPAGSTLSANKRELNIGMPSELSYGQLGDVNFNAVSVKISTITPSPEVWFVKGDEDFMVGVGDKSVTATPLPEVEGGALQNSTSIAMKHALSMIVVQVKMEPTNPEISAKISNISISNAKADVAAPGTFTGPLTRGVVNIETGVFTPSDVLMNYSRPMLNYPVSGNYYFGMLVYPANITAEGDVEVTCVVGSAKYTYKVPVVNWEAGKVYLYTLTLQEASVVMDGSVKVVDWPAAIEQDVDLE